MRLTKDVVHHISQYSFPCAYMYGYYSICERIRNDEPMLLQIISEDSHCLVVWNKAWMFRKSSGHSFLQFESEVHFKQFLFDNLKSIGLYCELRILCPNSGLSLVIEKEFNTIIPQIDLIKLNSSIDILMERQLEWIYNGYTIQYNVINNVVFLYNSKNILFYFKAQNKYYDLKYLSYLYFEHVVVNYFQ